MKKTILVLVLIAVGASGLWSQSIKEDREVKTLSVPEDGRFKMGLLLGYPSGVTMGYRFSNWFEANLTAGYNFVNLDAGILSANGLFTMVNIPVGDAGVIPLSLGPQVNFIFGGVYYLEIVGDLRAEYTFEDIPLNLFLEFGVGVRLFEQGNWLAYNGGLGVRYVF